MPGTIEKPEEVALGDRAKPLAVIHEFGELLSIYGGERLKEADIERLQRMR